MAFAVEPEDLDVGMDVTASVAYAFLSARDEELILNINGQFLGAFKPDVITWNETEGSGHVRFRRVR